MSTHDNPLGGLRSSLADAAFAVEERVLWRGKDGVNGLLEAARWPFERVAWALERAVIWPLEERTGDWSGGLRTLGIVAAALVASAAGVLGLVWASGGSGSATQRQATASGPAAIAKAPARAPAPAAPVLHGAQPNFKLEAVGGGIKVGDESTATTSVEAGAAESSASTSSASTRAVKAGPAATKVAHRFAGAFVLYEIGQNSPEVRTAFGETATPRLTHTLLRRPPRLPADAKVPEAKVLNIVPGPRHGDTYTLSVSLLRLGITSELRLDMQRDKSGKWQVTDARG
jgi:hypothetical protein